MNFAFSFFGSPQPQPHMARGARLAGFAARSPAATAAAAAHSLVDPTHTKACFAHALLFAKPPLAICLSVLLYFNEFICQ